MQKPTILIIAGGENSRFYPLNTQTHKGFSTLVGKPIVAHALENLKKNNYQKVVIVVSQKDYGDQGFSKYLKENDFGLDIKVVLQNEPKGMGDAILVAKDFLDEFFIVSSPYYFNLGDRAEILWNKKNQSGANCVFSGTQTENTELYGILNLDPTNPAKVLGIIEKPQKGTEPSKYKIDSVYLFDKKFIQELNNTPDDEYSLENAITSYSKNNNITWIKSNEQIKSIKFPWHLFNSFNQIITNEKTNISNDATISKTTIIDDSRGPVIIASGAKVGDFSKISGPCYIGKNCLVGDYSFVRGSSIEKNVIIGAKSEVVRCIFFENSSIHYGYIADSIIGFQTKIGAGLITANKRLDRKNIKVLVKNKFMETGINNLGIITGNYVKIGIGVKTMPGILIGENTIIYPGLTIINNIDDNEIIKE
ncbi:MAG: hypothetical protein H6772_04880 [Pseudomonadales bacterium]|nr:hypothetical protein [Pseudomonadales bacterium]